MYLALSYGPIAKGPLDPFMAVANVTTPAGVAWQTESGWVHVMSTTVSKFMQGEEVEWGGGIQKREEIGREEEGRQSTGRGQIQQHLLNTIPHGLVLSKLLAQVQVHPLQFPYPEEASTCQNSSVGYCRGHTGAAA